MYVAIWIKQTLSDQLASKGDSMRCSLIKTLSLITLLWGCADIAGDADLEATDKIINGQAENGVPQAVRLMVGTQAGCTGTLITPSVVLTAAHCIQYDGGPTQYTHIDVVVNGQTIESVNVSSQIMHSSWVSPNSLNDGVDIALLYLTQAVTSTGPMGIDRMPPSQYVSTTGKVVGFGRTDNLDPNSGGTKNSVVLNITGYEDDISELHPIPRKYMYTLSSTDNVTRSACMGDSGGPLLKNGVAGVASYVDTNADRTAACVNRSFYTSVYPHLDWINTNLNGPRLGRVSFDANPIEAGGDTGAWSGGNTGTDNGTGTDTGTGTGTNTGTGNDYGFGTGSASCEETYVCLARCEGDESCQIACGQRASQQGFSQLEALLSCEQQMQCADVSCVQAYCSSQLYACFPNGVSGGGDTSGGGTNGGSTSGSDTSGGDSSGGGSGDQSGLNGCLGLVSCLNTCDTNQTCREACGASSTQQALQLFNQIVSCFQSNCSSAQDPDACLYERCSAEVNSCENDY